MMYLREDGRVEPPSRFAKGDWVFHPKFGNMQVVMPSLLFTGVLVCPYPGYSTVKFFEDTKLTHGEPPAVTFKSKLSQ